MSYSNAVGPAVSNRPQDHSSLSGCLDNLMSLINRASDANLSASDHADRLAGHDPKTGEKQPSVEPVPSGVVATFAQHLDRLDGILNSIVYHQGRVSRAIIG